MEKEGVLALYKGTFVLVAAATPPPLHRLRCTGVTLAALAWPALTIATPLPVPILIYPNISNLVSGAGSRTDD